MNNYCAYYREKLYPFQDGILKIVKELGLPFYLTGGTALSRFYYDHRFSEDLDFFVNSCDQYGRYIQIFWDYINKKKDDLRIEIDTEGVIRSENFTQFVLVHEGETFLQLDFVNDIDVHFAGFQEREQSCPVDSWRNILSNKISALYRFEPKDYVDVWTIWKHETFEWNDIIGEAKMKEAAIDMFFIADLLKTIPMEQLDLIRWTTETDVQQVKKDLALIGDELLGL